MTLYTEISLIKNKSVEYSPFIQRERKIYGTSDMTDISQKSATDIQSKNQLQTLSLKYVNLISTVPYFSQIALSFINFNYVSWMAIFKLRNYHFPYSYYLIDFPQLAQS